VAGASLAAAFVSLGGYPVTVTVTVTISYEVTNARLSRGLAAAIVAQRPARATVVAFMVIVIVVVFC
jgi:hypothetical protein